MFSAIQPRKPRLVTLGHPDWWHHHGEKINLAPGAFPLASMLGMRTNAVTLTIAPDSHNLDRQWQVRWTIRHSRFESDTGTRLMGNQIVAAAFGLTDYLPMQLPGDFLLEKYGGDVACQFLFIRWQDYLNIPGPGTGHDGDPNISIKLTDEIKEAIRALLASI